ncbi:leucyl/phenylalanyl-tRNA--protein transferase [Halpernia humi]|nr:leucyl/phenylalanyl-tRNA--protein transferase [Halpernia humi]
MFLLDPENISFPDPELFHPESGLLAIGSDLSAKRLELAYENGIFPWFNEGEEILWWCPDPRFVLFPENLKISKSMAKILRRVEFQFNENKCFREVLLNCRNINRPNQDGTWLTENLMNSLEQLFFLNKAKSIEVWQNNELVGGFYGVLVGNVFCGESMFSKVSNASKAGFINFIKNHPEIELIDCQIHSEHLESLGAKMISKADYLKLLKKQK